MAKHHIGGIPVVDNAGRLIGIVTNRDLRFQDNKRLPISEIMTRENLVTAKKGISCRRPQEFCARARSRNSL